MDSAYFAAEKWHANEKTFKCHVCHKSFIKKYSLKSHLVLHTGIKPFECEMCQKKFGSNNQLIRHIRVHTDEFQCDTCEKRFSEKKGLTEHYRSHTGERPFQCVICEKKFNTKSNWLKHVKVPHTGERTFQCDICQKRFANKALLTANNNSHTVECDVCQKSVNRNFLACHRMLHTLQEPLQCIFCEKIFTYKSSLIRHIKLHTGEKPFKCDLCQRRITSRSDLTRYIEVYSGLEPFQCDHCMERCRLKSQSHDVERDLVVKSSAVEADSTGHHSKVQIGTSFLNKFDDEMEEKVKVEDTKDPLLPADSTSEDAFVKSDFKIETDHCDLELHSDDSEHIVEIEKSSEEDGDKIETFR